MFGPVEPAVPDEDTHRTRPSSLDESDRAGAIAAFNGWSTPPSSLQFAGVSWNPDLIDGDGRLLHLHLVPDLAKPWERRIAAATSAGRTVVVAAPLEYWYSSTTLATLAGHHVAAAVLVQGTPWSVREYRSVARLVALEGVLLEADVLRLLTTNLLDDALAEPDSFLKGRKFEEVIGLLLGQTSFFQVIGFNLKNATEEADVLLKNRRVADRAIPSAPIVLVSAKNEVATIGKEALVALVRQMDNKRDQCKLGFLCASRKLAKTVVTEDIGNRGGDRVVALMDGDRLRTIIANVDNLDDEIERLVIEGAMR
jgi:Restriction endonuclease